MQCGTLALAVVFFYKNSVNDIEQSDQFLVRFRVDGGDSLFQGDLL